MLVLALVSFGFVIASLCFVLLRSLEAEKADAAFQHAAQQRIDDLQSDLNRTVSQVVALGAFCEASYPVTHSSFNMFVLPILAGNDPGIQALEWIPRVTASQRAAFEASVRASGFPNFEIRERAPDGTLQRAGDRPIYLPVLYFQPGAGNQAAFGYDLFSEKSRRETVLQASYNGELAATQRVTLVTETANQYGVIILRSVYSHPGNPLDKRELLGFAVGVLRIGDVVEKHVSQFGVDLAISDLSAAPEQQQLYPSAGKHPLPLSRFTRYQTISVGGRDWRITASPVPGAFPLNKTYSYAGCAFCLLFTLLAAAYVADTSGRRRQVECLVEERTSALNSAVTSMADLHRGLEESELRFRRLIEDSPGAIVVVRHATIILANHAALELLGFNPAVDLSRYNMLEFVAPERRKIAAAFIQELSSRPTRVPARETKLLRPDGQVIDVEVAASSYRHEGEMTIQFALHDISQRKNDEEVNARLIRAIEQVEESIVVTDLDARIVYVNPAFERITGYSREEAIGLNPRILKSGQHNADFYAQMWQTLKSGESWSGVFINRTKSGRFFTEKATISPVLNRLGQIINYVAVKRDVTLETELQEQLHQSQKMDAVGRLAGGVAHDFNNMLMVIVSYAELIANSLPDDDPMQDHTGQILRAAQRSSALTRQLLAFSRKQVLAPQVLDCNVILGETCSMVRRLISENIELKCDFAPGLWQVKADADQIVQVILNLCVNSRDAMPNGGVLTLSTRNYHLDQGFVEISVADNGIGIPLDVQEKLFEPFFTTKQRGKGTGLGLATVYGIVQQSGGHIRVESLPGQGATFTIFLPRCREAVPQLGAHVGTQLDATGKKPLAAGRSLVLVVEDEDALRQAIAEHLRNHGYQVLAASDGLQALDLLLGNPEISILISDLIMPRMGGRELARLALTQRPNLRVIYMSGYVDQELDEDDGSSSPMVFLQKPFAMNLLMARISDLKPRAEFMSD